MRRRDLGYAGLALGAAALLKPANAAAQGPILRGLEDIGRGLEDIEGDAVAELAYFLGQECYVFGFPLVLMDATNRILTATTKAGDYTAPYNQLLRMPGFVPADFETVVRVSVSSVWSGGVFDLEKEPLVFSYPESDGRYFVVQLMNMWTDDFASLGTRVSGNDSGNILIAGPKWTGTAPPDLKNVYRCATRYGWVLVQMAAAGPQDFPAVHKLQAQLKLTPLSVWGKPYSPPDNVAVDPTVDLTLTPFDAVRLMTGEMFFARLAQLLVDNPPYPADSPMLSKLKRLGVEPGKPFNRSTVDPAIIRGVNRVPPQIWLKFDTGPYAMPNVNGWINLLNLGRYGTDYTTRAFIAYFGLGALTSDDCVYPTTLVDGDGQPLDGSKQYILHFPKDQMLPSKSGVWSVSPYRENFYVPNPLNRYGILSNMPLKYNADRSLDIYIQARSPDIDKEANWLPCPPSDPFNLTIRVYQPGEALLDGSYKIPAVKRL